MMSSDRFIRLVEENGGFEFYQAYQKDVDHILGGKNNTYWYVIAKKGKPMIGKTPVPRGRRQRPCLPEAQSV